MANRFARLVTLIFAAAQFALPAVASVADGAAAAGGRNSAAHVESKGDRDCKPPHTADCAICRFLTTTHGQTRAAAAPLLATVGLAPTHEAPLTCAATGAQYGFDSRAPPTLLD
jgi:hypothetical protein